MRWLELGTNFLMGRETVSGSAEGPWRCRATGAVVCDHVMAEVFPLEDRISSRIFLLLPEGTDGTKRPSSSLFRMVSSAASSSPPVRTTFVSSSEP